MGLGDTDGGDEPGFGVWHRPRGRLLVLVVLLIAFLVAAATAVFTTFDTVTADGRSCGSAIDPVMPSTAPCDSKLGHARATRTAALVWAMVIMAGAWMVEATGRRPSKRPGRFHLEFRTAGRTLATSVGSWALAASLLYAATQAIGLGLAWVLWELLGAELFPVDQFVPADVAAVYFFSTWFTLPIFLAWLYRRRGRPPARRTVILVSPLLGVGMFWAVWAVYLPEVLSFTVGHVLFGCVTPIGVTSPQASSDDRG